MVYIILGVVAFFCFAFCIYMVVKFERKPVKHKPAWKDEDADEEEDEEIDYRRSRRTGKAEDKSTPWRHDPQEDELPEEEEGYLDADYTPAEEVYDLSAKKKDAPAPQKYKKSRLLRTLEIICAIEFVIALILLIWRICMQWLYGG